MVNIEFVDLRSRGVVLPHDRVGFVCGQLHVPVVPVEPFQCGADANTALLAQIQEVLKVAEAAHHRAEKTHFTVFPEYSIPGTAGVDLIDSALRRAEWPTGTIVMGGCHGLNRDEYAALVAREGSHCDEANNGPSRVPAAEWINTAVVWVKSREGNVERWFQPKICAAWPENAVNYQDMFRGGSVFLFEGLRTNRRSFRFSTLVCFDWMKRVGDKRPQDWLLERLEQTAPDGADLPFSWLFVIQRNDKPSHADFLTSVAPFFDGTHFPRVRRAAACVVFVNSAGRPETGRTQSYGATSLVFSHEARFVTQDSPLTFSNGGARFRDGDRSLHQYTDVFFRERGACIHSFAQIDPDSIVAGPEGRTQPVEHASVFPVSGNPEPRAPKGAVPACVKWLNDQLDDAQGLARYHATSLIPAAQNVLDEQRAVLRSVPAQKAGALIDLAVARARIPGEKRQGPPLPDAWAETEEAALEHVLQSLNVFGLISSVEIGAAESHAVVQVGSTLVHLAAVYGPTHVDCIEHAKSKLQIGQPMLLVSRDRENSPWDPEFGPYKKVKTTRVTDDVDVTDPESHQIHIGYQQLMTLFLRAQNETELRGGVYAALGV